jgi:hypothetical protein
MHLQKVIATGCQRFCSRDEACLSLNYWPWQLQPILRTPGATRLDTKQRGCPDTVTATNECEKMTVPDWDSMIMHHQVDSYPAIVVIQEHLNSSGLTDERLHIAYHCPRHLLQEDPLIRLSIPVPTI